MASLIARLRGDGGSERYSLTDYVQWITSGNARFPSYMSTLGGDPVEGVGESFTEYVQQVYKRNGIVFACMALRQSVFAEVRFRFARERNGRLDGLFTSPQLRVLDRPWPNGTTGELATRMIQDADLAGNFYAVRRGDRLYRRNPQRMAIVLSGDPTVDEFVDVAGYVYRPDGERGRVFTYTPEEVCHWSPLPDPEAEYRGMSWLTPVIREVQSDGAATDHKLKFFKNGATPNMVVTLPESVMTEEQFHQFKAKMEEAHRGHRNAYKTLFLAPGADVTVVGSQFAQMDFKETQGRDETRIASAAGVPATLVGLKESLQGSSLNSGNYGQARRRFADGTMRPLYRSAAAALESLTGRGPQGESLWYDESHVSFFREDVADQAAIVKEKMLTVESAIRGGYTPESAVEAVDSGDLTLLEHTGLYSVQLQPAGTEGLPQRRRLSVLRDENGLAVGLEEATA